MGLALTLASFWVGRTWQGCQSLNEQEQYLPHPAVEFTLMAATGEAHSIRAMRGISAEEYLRQSITIPVHML